MNLVDDLHSTRPSLILRATPKACRVRISIVNKRFSQSSDPLDCSDPVQSCGAESGLDRNTMKLIVARQALTSFDP